MSFGVSIARAMLAVVTGLLCILVYRQSVVRGVGLGNVFHILWEKGAAYEQLYLTLFSTTDEDITRIQVGERIQSRTFYSANCMYTMNYRSSSGKKSEHRNKRISRRCLRMRVYYRKNVMRTQSQHKFYVLIAILVCYCCSICVPTLAYHSKNSTQNAQFQCINESGVCFRHCCQN